MKQWITNRLKTFEKNLLSNWKYFLGITISMTSLFFSSTLIPMPFDNQYENEISNLIEKNAKINKYGYSLNSLEMERTGNSDYWIYSDNDLQNFQMRNQDFDGTRSYVFCAYQPSNGMSSFKYNGLDCTSILFESKFEENNFYFDLPLMYGKLVRNTDKNSIFITDTFAKKILNDKEKCVSSLVNKILTGESVCASGTSAQSFKIAGIFDTNNQLGKFLTTAFGDNVLFLSDYNSFQMEGALYFCGSNNTSENKLMVNFIYDKYKSVNNAARDLAFGYNVTYKFYDFDSNSNLFVLQNSNSRMDSILKSYQNLPILFSLMGILLFVANSVLTIVSTNEQIKTNFPINKTSFTFTVWFSSCIAILLNSIIYAYAPLMSLISGQDFSSRSTITSSVLFLTWIGTVLVLTLLLLTKRKEY